MSNLNVALNGDVKSINLDDTNQLHYFVSPDQSVLFLLDDIVRCLKFTRVYKDSSKEVVDVNKVNSYLVSLEIPTYVDSDNRIWLQEFDYYKLSYRSRSVKGLEFQYLMSTKIIPSIHAGIENTYHVETFNKLANSFNKLAEAFNALNAKVLTIEIQLSSLISIQDVIDKLNHNYEDVCVQINKLAEMKDQVSTSAQLIDNLNNLTREFRLNLIKHENNLTSIQSELDAKISKLEKEHEGGLFNKLRDMI